MKQRKAIAVLCSAALAVGGMFLITSTQPSKAAGTSFSGYSTGTNVFADLLKNLSPGVELANANVAFSGAAADTSGLKPLDNEMSHAVVPKDLETAAKAPIDPFHTYSRGSGLEVGLGVDVPNNPDVNQIILAGLAEQAASPPTPPGTDPPADGSVVSELPQNGGIPGDPLLFASLLKGRAKSLYNPGSCVTDPDALALGHGEAAHVELLNTDMTPPPIGKPLGDPDSKPLVSTVRPDEDGTTLGTVGSAESRVHLVPNGASTTNFGLKSETSEDILPVTLFKGTPNQFTIEVAGEWSLRALATGSAATSSLSYNPTFNGAPPSPTTPLITITPPGGPPQIVLKTQDIFAPDGSQIPQHIFIPPGPAGPHLAEISIGENPRKIGDDHNDTPADPTISATEVSGAVDVVRITLLGQLQAPNDHVAEVRVGHMESKAVVPAGGVSCPNPPGGSSSTTKPGGGGSSTTSTTGPGGGSSTTSTTGPGGGSSTTSTTGPNNAGASTTTTTNPSGGGTTSTTSGGGASNNTATTAPPQVLATSFSQTPTAEAQTQQPNFTG